MFCFVLSLSQKEIKNFPAKFKISCSLGTVVPADRIESNNSLLLSLTLRV